jgi:hypothetical protein
MENERETYPEGHFVVRWMVLGSAMSCGVGIPLGIATDLPIFFALGPAVGITLGMAVGLAIERKHRVQVRIRPLNGAEQRRRRLGVIAGCAVFVLGVAVVFLLR